MGCGGDSLTQPPAALPITPGELTGPTDYVIPPSWNRLTAIGCIPLGDSAVVGAIGVPISPSRLARYDCHGVARDSVARTVAEMLSTAAAADGRVTMMEFGTWELINYWQECSGESDDAAATYENGIWVLPDIGVSCTTWYEYQWVPEEGGGGEPPDAPPDEPPGGGGGSGDGGHQGDDPPPVVDSAGVDFFEPEYVTLPGDSLDCHLNYNNAAVTDYCAARGLIGRPASYRSRIEAANERMRAIGGICATFAATVDSLLARDAIHLSNHFVYSGWSTGGWGGTGGMSILESYVTSFYDWDHHTYFQNTVPRQNVTLQLVLAHEAEHLTDYLHQLNHIDADGNLMPHSVQCSDLATTGPG
jgi:hypothetical protein